MTDTTAEWQPISSAPKDGTFIYIRRGDMVCMDPMRWHEGKQAWVNEDRGSEWHASDETVAPSHWSAVAPEAPKYSNYWFGPGGAIWRGNRKVATLWTSDREELGMLLARANAALKGGAA